MPFQLQKSEYFQNKYICPMACLAGCLVTLLFLSIPNMSIFSAIVVGLVVSSSVPISMTYYQPRAIDRGKTDTYFSNYRDCYKDFGVSLALFFSVLVGIPFGFEDGFTAGVGGLLLGAFFIAPLVSFPLTWTHYYFVDKLNPTYIERLLCLHQVVALKTHSSIDSTFDDLVSILKGSKVFRIKSCSKELGVILVEARRFLSKSRITIFLYRDLDIEARVVISSRPSMDTNIVDYGENIKNLRLLEGMMKSI